MEMLQREAIYLWYYFDVQLRQIFWYWVLGMAVGSAVSVFLKKQIHDTMRALGQSKFGPLGICISSVLGIVSPLCMYGTIPIAASFSKSGVRDDWLAAFMMSSILLNPQLILYSAALGSTVLAVRILSCFLCGIVAGLCVRWFYKGKSFFHFSGFEEPKSKDTDPKHPASVHQKSAEEHQSHRPVFSAWAYLVRCFSAVCTSRSHDWTVRGE